MAGSRRQTLRQACRAAALVAACAGVAASASRHVQAELVAENESIRAKESFWLGLRLKMDRGWHTYWKNPGDAGLPTRIKWTLPEGFEARPIEWPYPHTFTQGPVTSYGYEDEVLLPVQVTPPASLAPGRPVTIAARAEWLECEEACVPGRADLTLTLPVTADAPRPAPAWSAAFAETRRRLPAVPAGWTLEAAQTGPGFDLRVTPPSTWGSVAKAYFFPEAPSLVDHAAPQLLARAHEGYRLELAAAPDAAQPPVALKGVLVVHDAGGAARAVRVDAPVTSKRTGGVAPQAKEDH
jgi:thiol:disulfide interchange protein DsbD